MTSCSATPGSLPAEVLRWQDLGTSVLVTARCAGEVVRAESLLYLLDPGVEFTPLIVERWPEGRAAAVVFAGSGLDDPELNEEIDRHLAAGVDGFVLSSGTGMHVYLSQEESMRLVAQGARRMPPGTRRAAG